MAIWNVAADESVGTTQADITMYNFRGDWLDVVKTPDGRVFVSIRRVCDALGIDFATQSVKLRTDPAATVGQIPTVGADGKTRDMMGIEVRSLPLWVATIHPSKVKASAREKLIAYKREAAEVLADHFIGKRGSDAGLVGRLDAMVRENLSLRAALRDKEEAFATERQCMLAGQRSTVCDAEFAEVRGLLLEVVDLWLAIGKAETKRAALQLVKHRAIPGCFGKGFRMRFLPREQVPGILRALEVLKSDAESEARRVGALPKRGAATTRSSGAPTVRVLRRDPAIIRVTFPAVGK